MNCTETRHRDAYRVFSDNWTISRFHKLRIYLCFSFCFVLTFVTRFGHRSIHSTKNTLQEVNVLRVDLRGNLFWRDLSKLLHRIILLFLRSVFFSSTRQLSLLYSIYPDRTMHTDNNRCVSFVIKKRKDDTKYTIRSVERIFELEERNNENGENTSEATVLLHSRHDYSSSTTVSFFLSPPPFLFFFFPFYTVTPFLSNLLLSGAHIIDVSFT